MRKTYTIKLTVESDITSEDVLDKFIGEELGKMCSEIEHNAQFVMYRIPETFTY